MDIQIIKKLGSGVMGTVYLSNIDKVQAITKIEKYDGDITTKSPYIRQLIFNEKVGIKYPKRFMTLISSGIINNCNHIQKLPSFVQNAPKKIKEYHKLRELWTKCSVLHYKPVLEYTLKEIIKSLSPKQKLNAFKYLKKSIDIMHAHGFIHRDLHSGNIMCDKSKKTWYIVDYGAMYHSSFITNTDDKIMSTDNYDMLSLIWSFIDNPIFEYIDKNNIKLPQFKKIIKHITNDERYIIIKQYLPKKITNHRMKNELICLICAFLFYDLYIDALEMTKTSAGKKFRTLEHPNSDYFLKIIKNIKI